MPTRELVGYPLSAAQQGIWYAQQRDPDNPAYIMSCCLDLFGKLHVPAFKAAVRQALTEAEGLRARFVSSGGDLIQEVQDPGDWDLPVHDVSADADPQTVAQQWMQARRGRPLGELLVDLVLLRLADDRHCWYVGYHQLVADGTGVHLFIKRVVEIYEQRMAGGPVGESWFTPLRSFLEDEAASRSDASQDKARRFFQQRYADRPAPPRLSAGAGAPVRGQRRTDFDLTAEEFVRLREAASKLGTRWFGLIALAMAVHTAERVGTDDVILSLVLHGRGTDAARLAPTRVANVLPLRISMAAAQPWSRVARDVSDEIDRLREHQRHRGEEIRREVMQPDGGAFFGPVINFVPWHPEFRVGSLTAHLRPLATIAPSEDLSLYCYRTAAGGLQLVLDGHPERISAEELELHSKRLRTILAGLATADPQQHVGERDWLTADDRDLLLHRWNDTATDLPEATLTELFKAQAKQTPDAIALESTAQRLTYAQLDRRADRLAAAIAASGASAGTAVAVLMNRLDEGVVAQLAIARVGGAYVPLDLRSPESRLRAVLDDVGATVMLVDESTRDHEITGGFTAVCTIDDLDYSTVPVQPTDPDATAYVMYTSGSTGGPKGVAVTHRNVVKLALDRAFAGPAHRRVLRHSPSAFDASTYETWVPLLSGGTVVTADAEVDALLLRRLLGQGRISALWLTAGLFAALAEGDPECLQGATEVWAGGEALPPRAVRRVLDACPDLTVVNGYGPTETTTFATYHRIDRRERIDDGVPIGRPLDNTRAYVLDERRRLLPPGAVGQLYVGGKGVARGYLGNPDLTAERFLPDPFGPPGHHMYATGDLVRWRADGRLQYRGRIDAQVKLHGFRIEPTEIETMLESHPAIARAAVTAKPHDGHTGLTAYLVAANGSVPSSSQLRAYLTPRLPDYMHPAEFVVVDRLPLTTNGKLDRGALGAAPKALPDNDSSAATPSIGETLLCGLFRELLDETQVAPDDHFFELGGHSLLAGKLIGRLRELFAVEAKVMDVFDAPTPTELARRLDLDHALDGMVAPVSSLQRGVWLAERLDTEPGLYNMPLVWKVDGRLDAKRLSAALARVIERHEALRTRFLHLGNELYQIIGSAWKPEVTVHGSDESLDVAALLRCAEVDRPFDLIDGPLLRAALVDAPDAQHLVMVVHHIVFDESSLPVLLEELDRYYSRPDRQDPTPRQFRQTVAADSGAGGAGLRRTVERLRGAPVHLPVEPPATPGDHGVVAVPMPEELMADIKSVQRSRGVSRFMLVAAAVAGALHRWTGCDEVTLGLPAATRPADAGTDVIGPCLNMAVIRSGCQATDTLEDLLDQVRATVFETLEDQNVPLDRVVATLGRPRRYTTSPYLDVVLSPQTGSTRQPRLGEVVLEKVPVGAHIAGIARFPITVEFAAATDRLAAVLNYRGDRFDRASVVEFASIVGDTLAAILTDPAQPLGTVKKAAAGNARPASDVPAAPFASQRHLETRISAIWCSVLGRDSVGVDDAFFEVGGTSLSLVTIHAKLCAELGVELPIQRLFENATIRSLARAIGAGQVPAQGGAA